MIRFLIALALLFGGVAMAPSQAYAEARWQNYGVDFAYASKEAAKADAANVFIRAGWPPEVARQMQKKMQSMPPDSRVGLKKGDRLDFMRSGSKGLWRNVLVDFGQLRGIRVIADADVWTLTVAGVTYEAILPDVCNNLAGRRTHPKDDCVWLLFKGEVGAKVSVNVTKPYVDTSECPLGISSKGTGKDGRYFNPASYKPLTQDAAHPCDWSEVNAYFQKSPAAEGCVKVADGWYAIKLNRSVLTNPDILVILCLTAADGKTTLSVDVRAWDYMAVGNGVYVATVWPSEPEIRDDYKGKTMLWWERDHRRGTELMAMSERWNQRQRQLFDQKRQLAAR